MFQWKPLCDTHLITFRDLHNVFTLSVNGSLMFPWKHLCDTHLITFRDLHNVFTLSVNGSLMFPWKYLCDTHLITFRDLHNVFTLSVNGSLMFPWKYLCDTETNNLSGAITKCSNYVSMFLIFSHGTTYAAQTNLLHWLTRSVHIVKNYVPMETFIQHTNL